MSDETNKSLTTVITANIPPTVGVIACGGAGINIVRMVRDEIKGRATCLYLDCGHGNATPAPDVITIGEGGSGGVRLEHAEEIEDKLAEMPDEDLLLADINIVVFSLSGGSGSVIGPLLMEEIAVRREKPIVGIVILSAEDQFHTNNSINTIESLRNIATQFELVIPLMVFDNRNGRAAIDRVMPYKIAKLVDILTMPTREIDKNDRKNWIDVTKTLPDIGRGLRLLHINVDSGAEIEDTHSEIWPGIDGHTFDSVISIKTATRSVIHEPITRALFEGYFETIHLVPMMGIIGDPTDTFTGLIKQLRTANAKKFGTEIHAKKKRMVY